MTAQVDLFLGRPSVTPVQGPVIVDLFAGGGGASEGIRQALGVAPMVAINHDIDAILMHARNHTGTMHLCEDIFRVRPFLPHGRRIDLLWASPDCTHHSRAKGGKPLESGRRALAWAVIDWAREVAPRIIALENVVEFEDWGPLDEEGRPIKERKGELFREWLAALQACGYVVEWRRLNAADYGAPTARVRLFLVARCDGGPIRWPAPTHGPGRSTPWRTAAECIDWSIPSLSIFASREEARVWSRAMGPAFGVPKRPLEEATQRRIAAGVRRYVLENPRPFWVSTANGEREGQEPRTRSLDRPLGTVCASGSQGGIVVPHLTKFYGTAVDGQPLDRPAPTITAGGGRGGGHAGLVAAYLAKHNGSGETWNAAIGQSAESPLHTITATDTKAAVQVALDRVAEGTNARRVAAFLTKFYGEGGQLQGVGEPLHTISTLDRFGLVTVELEGEPYVVVDIAMRMLHPRELANAQGFGPEYVLTGNKRDQVARIGNSVCPPVACALVRALFEGTDSTVEPGLLRRVA